MFREVPFYDKKVQEYWGDGGGEIVLNVDFGKNYTFVVRGTKNNTPQCYLYEGDTVVAGPGVREYSAAIQELFPPKELMMSTYFSAQDQPRGFFTMSDDERSKVFSYLLGLNYYDSCIELASTNIAELKKKQEVAESDYRTCLADFEISVAASVFCDDLLAQKVTLERELVELSNRYELAKAGERKNELVSIMDGLVSAKSQSNLKDYFKQKRVETSDELQLKLHVLRKEQEAVSKLEQEEKRHLEKVNQFWKQCELLHKAERLALKAVAGIEVEIAQLANRLETVDLSIEMCKSCSLTKLYFEKLETKKRLEEELLLLTWDKINHRLSEILPIQSACFDLRAAILKSECLPLRKETEDLERELQNLTKQEQLARSSEELDTQIIELESKIASIQEANEEDPKLITNAISAKKVDIKTIEDKVLETRRAVRLINKDELEAKKQKYTDVSRCLEIEKSLKSDFKEDRRGRITLLSPKIEEVANLILSNYQNGRFQIVLNTKSVKKSKSTLVKESFAPTIKDLFKGDERDSVSAGEGAMLSEALRLAISIVNAEFFAMPKGTLIRDEVTGSIDVGSLDTYLDILKYGMKNGSFDKVILACHNEDIVNKADYRIKMRDGAIVDIF